jgi:KDO2-lipid IV(A) lauroyltransferase
MGAYLLVRFILATLRSLPFPAALRLSRAYVGLLDAAVPKFRRTARRNLEIAGLPDPDSVVAGMWRSIARNLAVFARLPDIDRKNVHQWIRYDGFEHYQAAKARGRGVLFATAHLGNWELSAYAHALLAEPMNVLVRPLDNPYVDALVEKRRTLSGNRVIGKHEAARSILRALHGNEAVGILADQNVLPGEGVFVNVFGVPACATSAFAKIAHHTGAAVIPGFAFWSEPDRSYVLRFYPVIPISGDLIADTQAIQRAIEHAVRAHPDQWLWIHRRWKTRPPGEPPIY